MSLPQKSSLRNLLHQTLAPLGRVEIALREAEADQADLNKLKALRGKLDLLRREKSEEAAALRRRVLVFLTQSALRADDIAVALDLLRELDSTDEPESSRLELLLKLLEKGQVTGLIAQGMVAVQRWLGNEDILPGTVRVLLCWVFCHAEAAARDAIREDLSPALRSRPEIATLLALSLETGEPVPPPGVADDLAGIEPRSFEDWPALKIRAHLARARASEHALKWREMMDEVHSARALLIKPDNMPQGRLLERWSRFWLIRALLHDDLPREAEFELAQVASEGETPDSAWARLRTIVRLAANPAQSNPEGALAILEDGTARPDHEIVVRALRRIIVPAIEDDDQQLKRFADWALRIERVMGTRPWCRYAIGLKSLLTDHDNAESLRCFEAAEAPGLGSCPVAIFKALIAIIEGDRAALDKLKPALDAVGGTHKAESQEVTALARAFDFLQDLENKSATDTSAAAPPLPHGRISARIPAISAIRQLLGLLFGALIDRESLNEELLALPALPQALTRVPWAFWILQRLRMHRYPGEKFYDVYLQHWQSLHPACAWDFMVWLLERAVTAPWKPRSHASGLLASLERAEWNGSAALRNGMLEAHRGLSTGRSSLPDVFSRLKISVSEDASHRTTIPRGLLDAIWKFDCRCEAQYLLGRLALREHEVDTALKYFAESRQLASAEGAAAFLAGAKMLPLLDYWEGVARASRSEFGVASRMLTRSQRGPKAEDAEVQRALIYIVRDQHQWASESLERLEAQTPASLYATGLLEARSGHPDAARRSFDECQRLGADSGSPYVVAARSFLAGMAEKSEDETSAIQMYRAVLADTPDDEVSAARLGRLLLLGVLRDGKTIEAEERREIASLIEKAKKYQPAWVSRFAFLASCLGIGTRLPVNLPAGIATTAGDAEEAAWRQLLARMHLEQGDPDTACRLVEGKIFADAPTAFNNLSTVLRTWILIARAGRQSTSGPANDDQRRQELTRCAEELAVSLPATDEPELKRWEALARRFAGVLTQGELAPGWGIWTELEPEPFAYVPGLWSNQDTERKHAAEKVLEHARHAPDEPRTWQSKYGPLLRVVAHHALGAEDAFVAEFPAVEPLLRNGDLPVEPTALWKAAARSWYRRENWSQLTQADRPPCVAALDDPEARMLVGLSHARVAVRHALGDRFKDALQESQRSREILSPLAQAQEEPA